MKTVMFVDDSETALAATKLSTQNMDINVQQFTEATEALKWIQIKGKVDLIITDMNMPIMNGLEFLKELRSHDHTNTTPVLMLTTETSKELKEIGKSLGLTGWIVKPFKAQQLQSAIKRVLRI